MCIRCFGCLIRRILIRSPHKRGRVNVRVNVCIFKERYNIIIIGYTNIHPNIHPGKFVLNWNSMAPDHAAAEGECAFARPPGIGSATQMERMSWRMHIFVQESARLAHGLLAAPRLHSGCSCRQPARRPARPAAAPPPCPPPPSLARDSYFARCCQVLSWQDGPADRLLGATAAGLPSLRHLLKVQGVRRYH